MNHSYYSGLGNSPISAAYSMSPSIVANINGRDQAVRLIDYELSKKRTIHITGEINDLVADEVIAQIRYLSDQSDDDIRLYINSPGGCVHAGMAIYDAMKYGTNCRVATVATGLAASMGAFLLCAGAEGMRYATPSAEIMIHQPLGGVQGQATDITLVAQHIQNVKQNLASIMADACGKPVEHLLKDMDRDNWMNAVTAKDYGLIDHIGWPEQNGGAV